MGDPADPSSDAVQLNVADFVSRGHQRNMQLRVTLHEVRTSDTGERYGSYVSNLEIDCMTGSIVHMDQTRFVGQHWQGESTHQTFKDNRPMAFGGLLPNPKDRILKAACR